MQDQPAGRPRAAGCLLLHHWRGRCLRWWNPRVENPQPKGPFSYLPDTAGAPRQIPGWDPSTNKRKRVGDPRGPGARRDCIVCMGPTTPPVDLRAPVCARLDRVRVRVLGEPRCFCSINRARAICVRACAQVRERVRVCACPGVCVRGLLLARARQQNRRFCPHGGCDRMGY